MRAQQNGTLRDGITPVFAEVGAAPTSALTLPPGSIVRHATTYYENFGTLTTPNWQQIRQPITGSATSALSIGPSPWFATSRGSDPLGNGLYTGTSSPDFIRPLQQITSGTGTVLTSAPAAAPNRYYATPFFVNRRATLAGVRNRRNGGTAPWRYGLYSWNSGAMFPNSLLWDSGEIGGASGVFTLPIGLTFTEGWFWLVGACSDVASATFQLAQATMVDIGIDSNFHGLSSGSPSPRGGWQFDAAVVGTPLPATFPTTATAFFYVATNYYPTLCGLWS